MFSLFFSLYCCMNCYKWDNVSLWQMIVFYFFSQLWSDISQLKVVLIMDLYTGTSSRFVWLENLIKKKNLLLLYLARIQLTHRETIDKKIYICGTLLPWPDEITRYARSFKYNTNSHDAACQHICNPCTKQFGGMLG
jgi:hypothetical protein